MASDGGAKKQAQNERREAARQKAQQFREQQHRKERRRKRLIQGSVVLGVIAVLVVVAFFVSQAIRPAGPTPANMASDGIAITKGLAPVTAEAREGGSEPVAYTSQTGAPVVETYVDFMCPACGQFEQQYSEFLIDQTNSGTIELVVHPIAILDRMSQGTKYSTRAAAAAGAVANFAPDAFLAFESLLYNNQPEENTSGLTDDQLIDYAKQAIGDDKPDVQQQVEDAIKDKRFQRWVGDATEKADVPHTPYVKVNGVEWDNQTDFQQFLAQNTGQSSDETAASPSPSQAG